MDGARCGGKGRVLGGEGGHGLSRLVTEGLGARDRGSIRLQWNQVSHLELQRIGAAVRREGGGAERKVESMRHEEKWAEVEKNAKVVFKVLTDVRRVKGEKRRKNV